MITQQRGNDWKQKRDGLNRGTDLSSMVYGKVPPQALELEEAVLGAMMLEKDKQVEAMGILQSPDCFYSEANRKVYAGIRRLVDKRQPVDLLTVTEELRRSNDLELIGGAYYLTRLTMSVISSAHVESHSRIVQEKYLSRELIRISGEVLGIAYEDSTDVFELLDSIETELFNLSAANFKTQYQSAPELAELMRNSLLTRIQSPGAIVGVPTGYKAVDRLTGGLEPNTVTIVAARPSVGKTAFALNMIMNAAQARGGAGFFSLEMPSQSIMNRCIAAMSDVPLEKIRTGNMAEWEQHKAFQAVEDFSKLNLKIDDTGGLNIYELRSKARRMVDQGVGLIVIDYLQLMHATIDGKSMNREQEIAKISRDLKTLSKDLSIPVVALSQLSRAVETRGTGNKDPQLSDLRESGSIEQDADLVMFLTRPDYQKAEGEFDPMFQDDAYVHIAKSRNGKTDKVTMRFVKDVQRWFDLDDYSRYKEDQAFSRMAPMDNPRRGISPPPPPPMDFGGSKLFIQGGFQPRDFTQPLSKQSDDDMPF